MTLLATSTKPDSNFIKWELPRNLSRRTVTVNVATATTLTKGQVLGQRTTQGDYRPAVQSASDGSQNFGAIFVATPDNADTLDIVANTDTEVVVLNQDAMVAYEGLTVDSTYNTDTEIETLQNQMESAGIRVAENRPIGPLL